MYIIRFATYRWKTFVYFQYLVKFIEFYYGDTLSYYIHYTQYDYWSSITDNFFISFLHNLYTSNILKKITWITLTIVSTLSGNLFVS